MNNGLTKHAFHVAGLFVVLYVLCLLWRVTITDPAVETLHLTSLKLVFPGFRGYDALSVLWGAVLSAVYGFLASVVWHKLHKNCCEPK